MDGCHAILYRFLYILSFIFNFERLYNYLRVDRSKEVTRKGQSEKMGFNILWMACTKTEYNLLHLCIDISD